MAATDTLVRVVRTPVGELVPGRSLPGRGAWLCAGSVGCLDLAVRRNALARALRAPVDHEAVSALRARLGQPPGTVAFGPRGEKRARMEGREVPGRTDPPLGQEDPGL